MTRPSNSSRANTPRASHAHLNGDAAIDFPEDLAGGTHTSTLATTLALDEDDDVQVSILDPYDFANGPDDDADSSGDAASRNGSHDASRNGSRNGHHRSNDAGGSDEGLNVAENRQRTATRRRRNPAEPADGPASNSADASDTIATADADDSHTVAAPTPTEAPEASASESSPAVADDLTLADWKEESLPATDEAAPELVDTEDMPDDRVPEQPPVPQDERVPKDEPVPQDDAAAESPDAPDETGDQNSTDGDLATEATPQPEAEVDESALSEQPEPQPPTITELNEVAPAGEEPTSWVEPRVPNRQHVPSRGELARHLAWHICPFCGNRNESARTPCTRCGRVDNDETRRATVRKVGPWFVQDSDGTGTPGMRFAALQEMVRIGELHSGTVVRGPTTQQLWTFAARVRGLSHLFGLCWNCNRRLLPPEEGEVPDDFCIYCGALMEAPSNPDQQLDAIREVASPKSDARDDERPAARRALPDPNSPVARQYDEVPRSRYHATPQRRLPAPPRQDESYFDDDDRTIDGPDDDDDHRQSLEDLPAILENGEGDGLLSQHELATVFDLDRRRLRLKGHHGHHGRSRSGLWNKLILATIGVLFLLLIAAVAVFLFDVPIPGITGDEDDAPLVLPEEGETAPGLL